MSKPYHHPTLPLRTGGNDSDDRVEIMSPGDEELVKKIAAQKGFKSYLEHYKSSMSITSSSWCTDLKQQFTKCQNKFPPSAHCDQIRRDFMSDCGGIAKNVAEDKNYSDIKLQTDAKLRGMNTAEFLKYAKEERKYCIKCKEAPGGTGCEQVNKYCKK